MRTLAAPSVEPNILADRADRDARHIALHDLDDQTMFHPDDEQRRTVRALSGYGVPQEGIAIHPGIDPKTLRKHFRDDLDRGSVEATAKVAQTLFHLATIDKNVAAVIFWMQARAGWREKPAVEVSGSNGGALGEESTEEVHAPLMARIQRIVAHSRKEPETFPVIDGQATRSSS